MAVSTIPALKAALRTRLSADAGLAGVQITYGHPYPAAPAGEMIYLGNSKADNPTGGLFGPGQTSAAFGAQRREERYTLEVFASKRDSTRQDQQVLTERAFALAGVVEASIRAWGSASPVFGGLVRWVLVTSVDHIEALDDQNRYADVRLVLACAARI